jgi:hypothetical protein
MHEFIRSTIKELYGENISEKHQHSVWSSVNAANASDYSHAKISTEVSLAEHH